IEYYPGKDISNEIVKDADALIIRTRTKCNEKLLSGTSVKIITTATIGYDHIDIKYCDDHNIKWINAPGCNATSVMQYVASAMLNVANKSDFYLLEKTIGIVGVGNVGRKVQRLAENFGMRILLNDPPRERIEGSKDFCSLETIMEESDIITLHVPLIENGIDRTFHLLDNEFFENLSRSSILINTSRGEVIESSALKKAIEGNKVNNVVLDVWENEPDVDLQLLEITEIATPHIAGYSADGKANGTSVCVRAINEFFELGIQNNWYPPNIPDAEYGNSLTIDGKNKYDQVIFTEAILPTYDVIKDDTNFRKNPAEFELLRGNYPNRREFTNYQIELVHCHTRIIEKLINLNFNIKCN
ncbi:MAG: 4-phosphoerythronate dehydrogenase, partial [Melioribacteraceae bacterium]|nr:4-phosphoerythronate dehydrogenase [Melioribacteraceae bacterium]